MLNKKPKLKNNATIAFIAPAGCIADRNKIDRAKSFFEDRGYTVIYGNHLFGKNKYMSGTDEERLSDLHWAFSDNNIDAIICARGGYGCLRLVDKIDYNLIRKNPKFFCGYSDITVLSAMFLKKAELITYSGPMANGDFGAENVSDYTLSNFFKTTTCDEKLEYHAKNVYKEGSAEGILFGGNLASIVSLCGIDFLPDEKFIFFTEDLNEPVYKIDKMLTQLINIDKFRKNVSGIIFGDFLNCGYENQLKDLFYEVADKLNIPVSDGYKITHEKDKITLPYGSKAYISGTHLIY